MPLAFESATFFALKTLPTCQLHRHCHSQFRPNPRPNNRSDIMAFRNRQYRKSEEISETSPISF